LKEDVERVAAAREAIGPRVDLLIDPNQAYSPAEALAAAHAFAPYDVYWYEDPIHWYDDLRALAELALKSPIRIAAGEYENTKFGCRDLIRDAHLGVLMFDSTWSGGLTEGRKVAALAEAHHIPLSPHHDPQIHVHLAAGCPNGLILESFPDERRDPVWAYLYRERPQIRDGYIEVPNRPGLGIELDESALAKYATKVE
ncbi:MAG: mandelate racemase/muconate lactonizing enzyme family protein, partial [Chloroflexi bacterium]|nr:mandelate racemase/muconate lactonizing enzyme family protein [Chloroflexota bacterium]